MTTALIDVIAGQLAARDALQRDPFAELVASWQHTAGELAVSHERQRVLEAELARLSRGGAASGASVARRASA